MYYLLENINDTFRKINKSSLTFLSPLTPEEMYASIVKDATNLFHALDGRLLLKEGKKLETVYTSSDEYTFPEVRLNGLTSSALKAKKIQIAYSDQIKDVHPMLEKMGIKTTIFIPLYHKDFSIGVLNLRIQRKVRVNSEILELLKLYGSLASMAIQKTYLYNDVKRALEVRDLFIGLASHELRTPLTGITIYAQLLEKHLGDKNTKESRWIKQLLTETHRLTSLTQELLQIDQIKTEKFAYHLEPIDIISIIGQAVEDIQLIYPPQQIEFMKKLQKRKAMIIGDRNKILQVLINILSNAVKFATPGTSIKITLTYSSGNFYIDVTNQGKGIPSRDLGKIFERFYKASNNFKDGMGLGLFITKQIITAHKGSISIESILNKETIIHLRLPQKIV